MPRRNSPVTSLWTETVPLFLFPWQAHQAEPTRSQVPEQMRN